jgi:hypothetical protein
MVELKLKVPDGLDKIIGELLEKPDTKAFLNAGIEERLKTLILFEVVDKTLTKSKLTDDKFDELVEEFRTALAKKYEVI